jgi:hypothetical protein
MGSRPVIFRIISDDFSSRCLDRIRTPSNKIKYKVANAYCSYLYVANPWINQKNQLHNLPTTLANAYQSAPLCLQKLKSSPPSPPPTTSSHSRYTTLPDPPCSEKPPPNTDHAPRSKSAPPSTAYTGNHFPKASSPPQQTAVIHGSARVTPTPQCRSRTGC